MDDGHNGLRSEGQFDDDTCRPKDIGHIMESAAVMEDTQIDSSGRRSARPLREQPHVVHDPPARTFSSGSSGPKTGGPTT